MILVTTVYFKIISASGMLLVFLSNTGFAMVIPALWGFMHHEVHSIPFFSSLSHSRRVCVCVVVCFFYGFVCLHSVNSYGFELVG